ncbi:MAG: class C sortase [Lachnospiraceae bacterium]|nr:class C sortase [Lachnospiraceae bacterium]
MFHKRIIRILLIVTGGMLLVYPWIGNWFYDHTVRSQAAGYEKNVEAKTDEKLQKMMQAAQRYNRILQESQGALIYPPVEPVWDHENYESVLRMDEDGLMGFIEIPQIHVYLPIYHGTSEAVLQRGAGHLEGSSLPIGGPGTKAVISAHTGLNNAAMFSDLTELQEGDLFLIHVLNETLIYEVYDIEVVLPEETQILAAESDRDLVTLLTCTPYGQNTHRLLVTGQRTEGVGPGVDDTVRKKRHTGRNSQWMNSYAKAVCVGVGMLGGLYVASWIIRKCSLSGVKSFQAGRKKHDR